MGTMVDVHKVRRNDNGDELMLVLMPLLEEAMSPNGPEMEIRKRQRRGRPSSSGRLMRNGIYAHIMDIAIATTLTMVCCHSKDRGDRAHVERRNLRVRTPMAPKAQTPAPP